MTVTATAPKNTVTSAVRVLDVFRDLPTATAKQIQDVTGLSRTTVNDNLRKLATSGDVIRLDQDGTSSYSLTPTRKAANKREATKIAKAAAKAAAPKATKTTTLHNEPTPAPQTGSKQRRTRGVIDAQIIALFQSEPATTWGSYTVAKRIGSSAGAAYVALKRMDRENTVALVSTGPDRYALA